MSSRFSGGRWSRRQLFGFAALLLGLPVTIAADGVGAQNWDRSAIATQLVAAHEQPSDHVDGHALAGLFRAAIRRLGGSAAAEAALAEFDTASVWMIMGSIILLIMLFYMMHIGYYLKTPELKLSAWKLIYMFISIFLAVMWFQLTVIVMGHYLHPSGWWRIVYDTILVILWLIVALGIGRCFQACWWLCAPLLGIMAHIVGFQLILLIGETQELSNKTSMGPESWALVAWLWGMAISVVLLMPWRSLMVRVLRPRGTYEEHIERAFGIDLSPYAKKEPKSEEEDKDEQIEKEMEEELTHEINEFVIDAFALASSFTFVRIIATWLHGKLPELFFLLEVHDEDEVAVMYVVGVAFTLLTIVVDFAILLFKRKTGIERTAMTVFFLHCFSAFMRMTGAWSLVLAVRWMVHAITHESGDDFTSATLDRIIVATVTTVVGFFLTILASLYLHRSELDRHKRGTIRALGQCKGAHDVIFIAGLCVAFTWELSFELAKEQLDHHLTQHKDAQIAISFAINLFFSVLLLPGLLLYIYPMVENQATMIALQCEELKYDFQTVAEENDSDVEAVDPGEEGKEGRLTG